MCLDPPVISWVAVLLMWVPLPSETICASISVNILHLIFRERVEDAFSLKISGLSFLNIIVLLCYYTSYCVFFAKDGFFIELLGVLRYLLNSWGAM